jgi:hypothetical protein
MRKSIIFGKGGKMRAMKKTKHMKTYVLMVSEVFPKSHKKSGKPTGFPLAIKHYDKIHTIRGNYELWAKRFKQINEGKAMLSVRIWLGKPYRSKQGEIFRYDYRRKIGLQKLTDPNNFAWATIDCKQVNWEDVAKNDGLSFDDFCEWFKNPGKEPMAVIHLTDFRY